MTRSIRARSTRIALVGAVAASALMGGSAFAQATSSGQAGGDTTTAAPLNADTATEVVVTGYRSSLAQSTNAKRVSSNFSDSIFAEDIGKFPDTNIAESFNRIPGITITRDITGEGVNVAIRGLGSNFTNVTLNGAPIAVASSGATDAQGTDRSVDLSFFPTDLFTKLTVNKSYSADLLEGGAAGNIDIRSARPFDRADSYIAYNIQGAKLANVDRLGARGSLIGSLHNDTIGILAGVSGQRFYTETKGFETIGYTNPALSAAQCGATTGCNPTGGGNWTIPATVPVGAGGGLVAGTVIDQAFLLAHNPGATIQQIDNALLPRLGRPSDERGRRDRVNGVVSVEWRPTDSLHFYVDGMYGYRHNDLVREDMAWIVRNGSIIPMNLKFDKSDCSAGCTVTSGTFANVQFFDEFRPYIETSRLWNVNPGLEFQVADNLKLTLQGDYGKSRFHRESPTVGPTTPLGVGNTVTYSNDGGIPTIKSDLDLNNPANFGWNSQARLNLQEERRWYKNKGVRGDLTWGGQALSLKVGGAYDDVSRRIRGYDNTGPWQNAACGNNPSVTLPSPNGQPPCQGLNVVGAAPPGYPTYPAYGTGYTAGQAGPITYGGSLVPNAALPGYLMPGPAGFVTVDFDKFAAATNYQQFHENAPDTGGSNTGASGGLIREQNSSGFAVLNATQSLGGNDLRINAGVRYVHTKQTIAGRVSLPDPRNSQDPDGAGPLPATCPGTPALRDGSCYPNLVSEVSTNQTYSKWLPTVNLAYDIGDHAVVRAAYSKTMTRPDPAAQLPGVSFGAPSADQANIGNPALSPYISNNIDLGVEYYTGREGVISFNAFRKSIQGFTNNFISTVPFSALAQYGITYDTLNPTQQTAINLRGGPNAASVQVTSQVNVPEKLTINGLEFQWVQPLDFVTKLIGVTGFGFNANATIVDQTSRGAAQAFSVAPRTYNATIYYEKNGVMLRVSTTYRKGSQSSSANQNGIAAAALFNDSYQQYDFSSAFDLDKIFGIKHAPQLTINVANFTNATLRSYFQFSNATFTQYKPGRQVLIGFRGSF